MNSEVSEYPPITKLSKPQRRVIGVLMEKAFTTPDAYPLTLKSLTTGCNQKSNRDPITNYTEDAVMGTLDELREMGAVAAVHTETGRTERFRHYMRKRFTFSERQLAILTELLLRGRQTLGDLRARAGRMVPIDSLEILRSDLTELQQQGFIQASGSLERRGIEVDHNFYPDKEGMKFLSTPDQSEPEETSYQASVPETTTAQPPSNDSQEELEQLRREHEILKEEVQDLSNRLEEMEKEFEEFRTQLGG